MSDELKIRFLGSTGEVERSGILISKNNCRLLLDYGVKLSKPPLFPIRVAPRELNGIAVSHAHLDHTGGLPFLYVSGTMKSYLTPPTLEITDLLIKDFLKLSGVMLPYEYVDFQSMRRRAEEVGYREEFRVNGTEFTVKLLNAGHIPGSSQILVDTGEERILFTGDVNNVETRLLKPMETDYGELDVVISESTYGGEIHPDRRETEKRFVERVGEVVEGGGIALIPTFAVGRSQEILLILKELGFKHRIYMDGMATTASEIILNYPEYLRDTYSLKSAMRRVELITKWRQRKKIIREPCALIAPAGMLGGGTVVFYLNKLYDSDKNGIFIVGFQVPGTPGKMLLEERKALIRGKVRRVKMQTDRFHFSSHIDRKGFEKVFRRIRGEPKFFLIHGNKKNLYSLSKLIREELKYETYVPKLGEEYEIRGNRVVKRSRAPI